MSDRLHDVLTAEGQRWREGLGPDPELADLLTRPPRRGRLLPALLAAAVIVAVVALSVAIAWPRYPSTSATHSGACQDDFTAAPTRFQHTSDGARLALRLPYTGTHACPIDGLGPRVDLLDARGHVLGTADNTNLLKRSNPTVEPGDVVAFTLTLYGICPTIAHPVTTVRLHMEGTLNTGNTGSTGSTGINVPATTGPVTCPAHTVGPGVIMHFGTPRIVTGPHRDTNPGHLSPHQRVLALRAAQQQANRLSARPARHGSNRDRWPDTITTITAAVHPGTVTNPNTAAPCTSGHVIVVRLIGTFPGIAVGGAGSASSSAPAHDSTVHEADVTLDATSGQVCLVGVRTGTVADTRGATILYHR